MIAKLFTKVGLKAALMAIPGVGPVLAFMTSPAGKAAALAAAGLACFIAGYQVKANFDEGATLRAVISKKDIDLRAAKDSAANTEAVLNQTAERDTKNQEVIRDLQEQLSKAGAAAGNCTLDDDTIQRLRRLE